MRERRRLRLSGLLRRTITTSRSNRRETVSEKPQILWHNYGTHTLGKGNLRTSRAIAEHG